MSKIVRQSKNLIKKLKTTGFGHLFGSSVINKILTFMSSIILVRLIPKSEYGIYCNADNILGMFCILEGFGMVSTFLQYGSTTQGKKKEVVWSFCFHGAVLFQIFLSMVIFITALTVKFSIPGTGVLLALMAFLPICRIVRDMQQIYLRTELKNKEYAYSNTLSTAITVVLSCVLSVFFLEKGIIIASYVSVFVVIIYIIGKCKIKFPNIHNSLNKDDKVKLLKFSAVCMVNNSTSSIMYLLDTFVLGIVVASSTVTASYKVASKIPTALAFIPSCVMTYIYPYFAKHKDDGKWCFKNYKKVLVLFGTFNIISVGTLIIIAPYVIRLIFGTQYLDALIPFRLLCFNYIVQATLSTLSGQLLVSQEKLWFNTLCGFGSSIINTILNLILIPQYEAIGAAIATVSVSVIFGIAQFIYLYTILKRKSRKVI